MKIYHYDPETRFLTNEGVADPSPVDAGDWLVPAHASAAVPPEITDPTKIARYDLLAGGWEVADRPAPPPEPEAVVLTLDEERAAAQDRIDAYAASFIPHAQMIAEYMLASYAARDWLCDTGAKPAPLRVQALAKAKELTNRNAAKLVLDGWDLAVARADRIGAARITAKDHLRLATSLDEVHSAEEEGREQIEEVA